MLSTRGRERLTSLTVRQLEERLYHAPVVRRAEAAAGHALHRAWLWGARDITDEIATRDTLVIAPHPDDETLACGGTIAQKVAAGRQVHVACVTDGRFSHRNSRRLSEAERIAQRAAEFDDACQRLGIAKPCRHTLGFEDHEVERDLMAVRGALIDLLRATQPAEVLIPWAIDANADHRSVHRAALAAIAHWGARPTVLAYPVWMWDVRAWVDRTSGPLAKAGELVGRLPSAWRSARRCRVGIADSLPAKSHALAAYRSQLTNITGEADWPTFDRSFLDHFSRPWELFVEVSS